MKKWHTGKIYESNIYNPRTDELHNLIPELYEFYQIPVQTNDKKFSQGTIVFNAEQKIIILHNVKEFIPLL